MNKYKRTNFLRINEVDGIIERDFIYNYWDIFEIRRPVQYYRLTRSDIERPDLLSIKVYGVMKYWWLLLKVNNIDDIWYDMEVGKLIIVPDINDFEDWLIKVISSKRTED